MRGINTAMKLAQLNEARYKAPPVEIKKLETLLDAVAKSIPFIGYEGGDFDLADQVAIALQEATGLPWNEWKKR